MNKYAHQIRKLTTPDVMDQLNRLYGSRDGMLVEQTARYTSVLKRHEEIFHAEKNVLLVSAPGRAEIGGNHTDHHHGKVLAAAINQDMLAAVSARPDQMVHVYSDGYPPLKIDLNDLKRHETEKGTTAALIRGVAARMAEMGYRIGGFDACVHSQVAVGSGLSSSAAFEVLVCAMLDGLYNGFSMDAKVRAQIGWYAENVYFGKPCGLLDQMVSSVGGMQTIDFKQDMPDVRPVHFDFASRGYVMAVVATGSSHEKWTDKYAEIPAEMQQVADYFHERYLRRVRYEEFLQEIPGLRQQVSDRAILRAMHFFQENERVTRQVAALEENNLLAFLWEVVCSGRSSYMYLQNVYPSVQEQSLALALAMAEQMLLDHDGAWRIHGGGFAGTTLNIMPQKELKRFVPAMEAAFGPRCCHVLDVRPQGAALIRVE